MHKREHFSLPLFDEPLPGAARPPADAELAAARRLARRIGRLADHSPEQVRAGQQICRHLLAMLRGAEGNPRPGAVRH
jgi:hypothetical protein